MRIDQIQSSNHAASVEARLFSRDVPPERLGVIDEAFHKKKNRFPYFGFVDVSIGGTDFVMFSSNDDLVAMTFFWYGPDSYEPMSMRLWMQEARLARCVLDVGAFSGVYGLAAASSNADVQVYSLEAARRTYGRLLVNTQINGLEKRLHPVNKAVSSGSGTEVFQRFRGENILGIGDGFMPKGIEAQAAEEQVDTVGLDAFCAEAGVTPDLIKIDVEGAELLAMDGMSEILSGPRPTLLIEVTPQTGPEVAGRLEKADYTVARVDERQRAALPWDGKVPGTINFFAKPKL